MKKVETRGRKTFDIDPVESNAGEWVRISVAIKRLNKNERTIRRFAKDKKIRIKIVGGVTVYYIKKLIE